jgi:multidrug efflux pump subunit AcrB
MIPNIFPVLLVFGLMGHLRIAVDIGTMMTASVAMGVAVDDTIHFLSWFRQYLEEGKNRVEAVIATYRKVGPAMTQTTIVGGLGLFVFALSTFTPTQRFGTLMLVMLAAALIGDLILLPALLVGPLGKFFKPRNKFSASTQPDEGSTAIDGDLDVNVNVNVDINVDVDEETSRSTGTGSVVVTQDVPILKVHAPPSREGSPRTTPKRR